VDAEVIRVVQLATVANAPEISALLRKAFAEYRALYTEKAFAATTPNATHVRKRMKEGPVWISLREDRVVGTIAAVVKPDGLYLRGMAVLPDARGLGHGVLLLDTVESFARENGARRLYLSTTPFLARAISLYESLGFRRTNEGPHELHRTPLFTMEKLLRSE